MLPGGGLQQDRFPTVRKGGYDKAAVDEQFVRLSNENQTYRDRLRRMDDDLEQYKRDLAIAREKAQTKPEHEQISERMAEILRIAEEEAKERRAKVDAEVQEIRKKAQEEIAKLRKDAEEHSERIISSARSEATELVGSAKKEAEQLREQAKKEGERRLSEAEARAKKIHDTADRRLATLTATHAEALRRLKDMNSTLDDLLGAEDKAGPLEAGLARGESSGPAPAAKAAEKADGPKGAAPAREQQRPEPQQAGTGQKPGTAGAAKPQAAGNERKPETAKPETVKPDAAKSEAAKPDTAKPETAGSESAQQARPVPFRSQQARPEPADAAQKTGQAGAQPARPERPWATGTPKGNDHSPENTGPAPDEATVRIRPLARPEAAAGDSAPRPPQGVGFAGPAPQGPAQPSADSGDPGVTGVYPRPGMPPAGGEGVQPRP